MSGVTVVARLKVEGIHHWPGCNIAEVGYLSTPHRHMFHITAKCFVRHDDRDVEFIKLSHQIRDYLTKKYWSPQHNCCNFGARSCESLARELLWNEFYEVEVSEDGEGGAIVERTTEE